MSCPRPTLLQALAQTTLHWFARDDFDLGLHLGAPSRKDQTVAIDVEMVNGEGPRVIRVNPTYKGRPADLDGPVVFEVANPELVVAEVLPDGRSIRIEDREVGSMTGVTEGLIDADVRSGPVVVRRTTVVTFTVRNPDADTLSLDVGPQEPPMEPATDGTTDGTGAAPGETRPPDGAAGGGTTAPDAGAGAGGDGGTAPDAGADAGTGGTAPPAPGTPTGDAGTGATPAPAPGV